MSVDGLNDLKTLETMFHEFFVRETYDWWRKVQPDDVVMDIGTAVGMFTCHALDQGAKRVYGIEPNIKLLETTMKNAMPHIVNNPNPCFFPINCFIGSEEGHASNPFGDVKDDVPLKSFKQIINDYEIDYIDYLKVDCEGGEYDIFSEENYDFLHNNVKHIAMEVHLDVFPEAPDQFIKFRDEFILKYDGKIRYLKQEHKEKTWDDEWIKSTWPIGWGGSWMIYLTKD